MTRIPAHTAGSATPLALVGAVLSGAMMLASPSLQAAEVAVEGHLVNPDRTGRDLEDALLRSDLEDLQKLSSRDSVWVVVADSLELWNREVAPGLRALLDAEDTSPLGAGTFLEQRAETTEGLTAYGPDVSGGMFQFSLPDDRGTGFVSMHLPPLLERGRANSRTSRRLNLKNPQSGLFLSGIIVEGADGRAERPLTGLYLPGYPVVMDRGAVPVRPPRPLPDDGNGNLSVFAGQGATGEDAEGLTRRVVETFRRGDTLSISRHRPFPQRGGLGESLRTIRVSRDLLEAPEGLWTELSRDPESWQLEWGRVRHPTRMLTVAAPVSLERAGPQGTETETMVVAIVATYTQLFLDPDQAAVLAGVAPEQFYRAIHTGELPHFRYRDTVRIYRPHLDRWATGEILEGSGRALSSRRARGRIEQWADELRSRTLGQAIRTALPRRMVALTADERRELEDSRRHARTRVFGDDLASWMKHWEQRVELGGHGPARLGLPEDTMVRSRRRWPTGPSTLLASREASGADTDSSLDEPRDERREEPAQGATAPRDERRVADSSSQQTDDDIFEDDFETPPREERTGRPAQEPPREDDRRMEATERREERRVEREPPPPRRQASRTSPQRNERRARDDDRTRNDRTRNDRRARDEQRAREERRAQDERERRREEEDRRLAAEERRAAQEADMLEDSFVEAEPVPEISLEAIVLGDEAGVPTTIFQPGQELSLKVLYYAAGSSSQPIVLSLRTLDALGSEVAALTRSTEPRSIREGEEVLSLRTRVPSDLQPTFYGRHYAQVNIRAGGENLETRVLPFYVGPPADIRNVDVGRGTCLPGDLLGPLVTIAVDGLEEDAVAELELSWALVLAGETLAEGAQDLSRGQGEHELELELECPDGTGQANLEVSLRYPALDQLRTETSRLEIKEDAPRRRRSGRQTQEEEADLFEDDWGDMFGDDDGGFDSAPASDATQPQTEAGGPASLSGMEFVFDGVEEEEIVLWAEADGLGIVRVYGEAQDDVEQLYELMKRAEREGGQTWLWLLYPADRQNPDGLRIERFDVDSFSWFEVAQKPWGFSDRERRRVNDELLQIFKGFVPEQGAVVPF